jgi:hypothetical protein
LSLSESSNDARGRKRSLPESSEAPLVTQNVDVEEPEDGLKLWGYMPGHVHYKVGAAEVVRRSSLSGVTLPEAHGLPTEE